MKIGLTLGKFAPLHCGHQYLIETALAEMDHVIVLIYDCPETTSCPLSVRARWIRDLYPTAEVLEAWDGPTIVGDSPEIKETHERYLLQRLQGRRITHFYSSEFYGDHVSKALDAVNRLVDEERVRFPVSGSAVRAALHANRNFVDPRVYRDLIANVVFLGAPSTGKSTLAEALAARYQTVWMPEYGREYWETHQRQRRLTPEQLVAIAEGHLQREDRMLLDADRFLFTDTNAITTYMFAMHYHGKADPRLAALAHEAVSRYDLTFLCEDDIPYDDTWDRSGETDRTVFQKQIVDDLLVRRVPFFRLSGAMEARMKTVCRVLEYFAKYENLPDLLGFC